MISNRGQRYTVNSRKFDGSIRRTWECELILLDDEKVDLVGEFETSVAHPDLGLIAVGTVSHERFYLNRWYNYFRFEHPVGTLRNYYINICMPPKIADGVIDYIDLDIDLIVWPDGRIDVLDLEEFEANALTYQYSDEVQQAARSTLEKIQQQLSLPLDISQTLEHL